MLYISNPQLTINAKLAKWLKSKIRYNGEIMTQEAFIKRLYFEGYRPVLGTLPVSHWSKTRANKLDAKEYAAYEARCDKERKSYDAAKGTHIFEITKLGHEYMIILIKKFGE